MSGLQLLRDDDSVLLLIDLQTRLAASMPAEIYARVRAAAIVLARAAGELGVPVLVTRQYPKGLGPIDGDLESALPDAAVTIDKTCFAASDSEALTEALRATGRRQVVIGGMETHVCVLQTAAGLAAAGHVPSVVADAACARDAAHHEDALARLRAAGITVTNHESALFEWLRDARHDRFKAVSALLR